MAISLAQQELKKAYRTKGLSAVIEFLESDLPKWEQELLIVKPYSESHRDNFARGQLEAIKKSIATLNLLIYEETL